jgi:hypothetical protein
LETKLSLDPKFISDPDTNLQVTFDPVGSGSTTLFMRVSAANTCGMDLSSFYMIPVKVNTIKVCMREDIDNSIVHNTSTKKYLSGAQSVR